MDGIEDVGSGKSSDVDINCLSCSAAYLVRSLNPGRNDFQVDAPCETRKNKSGRKDESMLRKKGREKMELVSKNWQVWEAN